MKILFKSLLMVTIALATMLSCASEGALPIPGAPLDLKSAYTWGTGLSFPFGLLMLRRHS